MLNHDSQVFTFSLPHFPIKNPMILTTGTQVCMGLGGLRNSQIHNRLKYNGENFKTESKRGREPEYDSHPLQTQSLQTEKAVAGNKESPCYFWSLKL
jgi:hypothetical protein